MILFPLLMLAVSVRVAFWLIRVLVYVLAWVLGTAWGLLFPDRPRQHPAY